MGCIADTLNRPINYLRVSVTDRCNLGCVYCMPRQGVIPITRQEVLRYEEIAAIVRAAANLGVSKVRLTGGEPLVRPGIANLISMLKAIPGIDDISLTTNGSLLTRYATELRDAGLRRVNVSLDTLREEKFRRITRRGSLAAVMSGVETALAAGLTPLKINVVVMRGINDDEILDFARRTLTEPWHVRFIEFMPFPDREDDCRCELGLGEEFMPVSEVRAIISQLGTLAPVGEVAGNGPARYYRLERATGTIGFISPVSEHFCFHCNRLRLTADGKLRPCLLNDRELDLRGPLRDGASQNELSQLISDAIKSKPARHLLADNLRPRERVMAQIGG